MIVKVCYFLKSIKTVFILVQCNTSLSKNYVAHSYVTVVCVIGWIWEKNRFVCALCAYKSVVEQGFFHEFAFDNKALKTFAEFQIWWKRSKSERRQIRIRTSSHPYRLSLLWASLNGLRYRNTVHTVQRAVSSFLVPNIAVVSSGVPSEWTC